jgi:alkylation response protein AidB-like acyl-CoA dehydrogenase
MNFQPTADQEQIVDSARRMYANDIEPILRRHPADQPLPKESAKQILQHFAKLGLTAARLPEEAGGPGMSLLDYGLIMEQLSPAMLFLLMPQEVTAARIHSACTDEQRENLLPKLISAERIACTATTEPDVGSDPKGIRLKLREDGDHFVLDGTKMWVSNATISDVYIVTCRAPSGEIVRVLVDRAESQVKTREIPVTGLQQCHLGEIVFEGTRVPKRNMLGSAGDASRILTLTWLGNRPLIGLGAVHLAQKAFEASVQYSPSCASSSAAPSAASSSCRSALQTSRPPSSRAGCCVTTRCRRSTEASGLTDCPRWQSAIQSTPVGELSSSPCNCTARWD